MATCSRLGAIYRAWRRRRHRRLRLTVLTAGPGRVLRLRGGRAGTGRAGIGSGGRLPGGSSLNLQPEGQHHSGGILTDGGDHLVEHIEALQAVFHYRVMLGVGSQPDAPLQLLHGVDVVHPLGIHVFQQNHPLQLSHQGRAENLLPRSHK